MEDIKLWTLDGTRTTPLSPNSRLESESLLEDTLVENPSLLMDGMTLIGRQTPTEGGPLDLLGIDPDGKLVVFELKRGTLSRDAVAQIIDYASYLDSMDLDALASHIAKQSGARGIDKIENFHEWYGEERSGELEDLKPLRMVLVGLGTDYTTERMVRFLAQNSGMDISLLTFHAFSYEGKTILAKQVEVEAGAEPARRSGRGRRSQAELDRVLEENMEQYGTRSLVDEVRGMFAENWPVSTERTDRYGLRVQLPQGRSPQQFARIDAWKEDTISVVFFSRAKTLCLDEFREPVRTIPFVTYPRNRDALDSHPKTEIQFHLSAPEWETHRERLTSLVQAIYAAWQDHQDEDDS